MFSLSLLMCLFLSLYSKGVGVIIVLGWLSVIMASSCFSPFLSAINGWFMFDQISAMMVLLVALVGLMSLVCSGEDFYNPNFCLMLIMSSLVSVMFFISAGLVVFFIFFEAGLVPLVILIMGWGYQPERLQACMSLILYTVLGSMPLMMMICWVFISKGTDIFLMLSMERFSFSVGVWLCMFLGFFVKMPVFGFHFWLPKAHVEAPVAGSMILAGVLLKFGCYGLMRVIFGFSWDSCFLGEALVCFGIWGGVISSLICLIQADMKSLIAYSSISHMSLVVVGIFSCSILGWGGSLIMMFSHGISSPLLFGVANYSFKLFHSRSMMLMKGLLSVNPSLGLLLFLCCILGMGCPPSVNFIAEVVLLSSGMMISWFLMFPIGMISFLGAAYSLYLYSSVSHGGISMLSKSWSVEFSGLPLMFMMCYSLFFSCLCLDFFYV